MHIAISGLHCVFPLYSIVDGNEKGLITINGTSYSIEESPPENSVLVREQVGNILQAVNLKALVKDLTKVGKFIRMALTGVTAAGHTELQIKVQKIGFSVAKLGSKSTTAVVRFRYASGRVLEALQDTYHFLLLGKEEKAVNMLAEVTDVAKDMSTIARGLQREFEHKTEEVREVLEDAMNAKGFEKEKKEKIALQLKEFDLKKQRAEEARKQAKRAEDKSWQLFEDARRKEYKALKKKTSFLKMIANAFTSAKFGFSVFGDGTNKEMAAAASEEKFRHLKYAQEQQALQLDAVQQVAEYMMRIENCKDSSQLADIAIDALQAAIGGLKALTVVMMRATEFWERMHIHVELLRQPIMTTYIAEMRNDANMTAEERKAEWNSNHFKRKAITYAASWVALYSVCTQYMRELEHVQDGIFEVIEENPTPDEARKLLSKLAKEYRPEIEQEKKGIEDEKNKTRKEMKEMEEMKEKEKMEEQPKKEHEDL